MYDRYNRKITYLRISVTDRCNLRCEYCMPPEGVNLLNHDDIISFEEIIAVVQSAAKNGISKIRITGGEPLLRRGIVNLVSMIAATEGIDDLAMTTNAILLDKFAPDLFHAGLKRINISLDTIHPEKFRKITRGGDVNDVLKGITAARQAGFSPIKINCVINGSSSEEDASDVRRYGEENELEVRFINRMDLHKGIFSVVEGGSGGDCSSCTRLRLTSDGYIKPCLFSDIQYNIRKWGIDKALKLAVENKPPCGIVNTSNEFNYLGG